MQHNFRIVLRVKDQVRFSDANGAVYTSNIRDEFSRSFTRLRWHFRARLRTV